MNSKQYIHEIEQFMQKHEVHADDFKMLVLRLLTLYHDNVKLVSAMTYIPETVILKWKSDWDNVIYSSTQVEFVNDGSAN